MAGPAADRVLQQLSGIKTISAGTGNLNAWVAYCPAHHDAHQSLQVSEREDYSVGLHCHAGCSKQALLDAMDLKFADLYAPEKNSKEPVKTYDYCALTGELLYQACRFFPKSFKQRRPDPAGKDGWVWDMAPLKGKHVPYRLPDLKGHTVV